MPHPIAAIIAAQTGTLIIIFTTLVAVSCCVIAIVREKCKNPNNSEDCN
ncbi:MAG TPA: hypothetical protein VIJ79_03945 [Acidobacteriaceae bacterium]